MPSSGAAATYFVGVGCGSSLVYGWFSDSHFFLPPFIILIFLWPKYLKTQNAKAANQLLKSPYKINSSSGITPKRDINSSNCCLLIISRVDKSLISFLHHT